MKDIILQTDNLNFGFNKNTPIVQNLNLAIEKGSIYGFLGPNGAGKTTTIRLILGLLTPQIDAIRVFGESMSHNRIGILGRVGSLIENPSLYEHLTGYENLEATRLIKGVSKNRIGEVLELVRLTNDAKRKVKEYSLGMKQRIGLAVALLSEPDLLILDEPTNGLDPNGMIEIRELLIDLNKNHGTTIFLSSHLLSEIEKMATHVGIINKGKLLFQGTIKTLQEMKSNSAVLQLQTSDNEATTKILSQNFTVNIVDEKTLSTPFQDRSQAASINRLLVQNGIDVYQLHVANQDLEQLFLDITNQ